MKKLTSKDWFLEIMHVTFNNNNEITSVKLKNSQPLRKSVHFIFSITFICWFKILLSIIFVLNSQKNKDLYKM